MIRLVRLHEAERERLTGFRQVGDLGQRPVVYGENLRIFVIGVDGRKIRRFDRRPEQLADAQHLPDLPGIRRIGGGYGSPGIERLVTRYTVYPDRPLCGLWRTRREDMLPCEQSDDEKDRDGRGQRCKSAEPGRRGHGLIGLNAVRDVRKVRHVDERFDSLAVGQR